MSQQPNRPKPSRPESSRPNIVMILSDDHAAHAIGAYGSVVNTTPRIDEIAAAGRRVDSCFCTNALCTPSRASILTGTYSHRNGVTTLATPMDASQPTFVSQLQEAGYRTALFGKWHLGEGPEHNPQGFDDWAVLPGQGEYLDPQLRTPQGLATTSGYVTDIITDMSLNWLDSLSGEEPWCLLVHQKAPHRPWVVDDAHAGIYNHGRLPLPTTFDDDYSTRTMAAPRAAMRVADDLTDTDLKESPPQGLSGEELAMWKYQRYMADYLGCVASLDDNVGRIIDYLIEHEAFDDTLIIYSSDQGFFLGDHGWYDKRFMYEQSLRMPLLISYPRLIEPGEPITQLITNVDFAQTILEVAGVEAAQQMQGVSFLPQLQGSAEPTRDALYYRYYENDDAEHHVLAHYGIRTQRYKLIYFYNDGMGLPGTSGRTFPPAWEMYDLRTDPDELRNVYHDASYERVRKQLQTRMWQLQAELGDEPHHSQPPPPTQAAIRNQ